ncbi:fasciclin domain-containing protein [Cyclobacterium sp. 1_MG-2023]|uniref:fasciclin domain-containing protein n=1 Tax=Cyclobacterium sp. 1_MG-2023 TaxID=3062681 RepID=UPI0026E29CA2|nr:fasciclin domain-containing protein [Cyclobacterium sp. 1_MG-2023]MDO6439641.1 fasciclin domain-containing protein [Cyclobacterium sp. 1_MG-2023]
MIKKNQNLLGLLFSVMVLMSSSCSDDDPVPMESDDKSIVELAQSDGRFSSLVAAAQRAELIDALSADGSITVFAPTDQAFTDAGITDVSAIAVDDLEDVLIYHVVPSEIPSSAVSSGKVTSLEGAPFYLSIDPDSKVWINGHAEVIETDLDASNGIIHVINQVIMKPTMSIAEIAIDYTQETSPEFTQLVGALSRANLVDAVNGGMEDDLTVFAPTDAAFQQLYDDLGVGGFEDIPLETLENVLMYHVVPARAFSQDLRDEAELPTLLSNNTLTVDLGELSIEEAGLNTDLLNIHATNGVIHVIDKVMLP